MSHQVKSTSPVPFSHAPRRQLSHIVATVRHPFADIAILLGILLIAAGIVLWPTVHGRHNAMPSGVHLTVGQQQGIFYVAKPAPDNTSELYVSRDGLGWRRLPATLPGTVHTFATRRISSPIMYASTSAGLFVTADAGLTWNAVTLPQTVTALAIDPIAADMVYVATAEPALYHMTDVGASRRPVAAHEIGKRQIHQIVIGQTNSRVVLARTDEGLFRSESAGEWWHPVRGAPRHISTVVMVPGDPAVWVAGTRDAGIYRSLDDGRTWQAANAGITSSPATVTALTVDPRRRNRLYLAAGTHRSGMPAANIYVSANSGATWVKLYDVPPGRDTITALVPAADNAIRAVTSDGVRTYTLNMDGALARLDSSDVTERLQAARLLSVTALPAQAYALLDHLGEPDPTIGRYVTRAIVRTEGYGVLPELIRHTQTGTVTTRRRAIAVLGQLRVFDAVPALAHILRTDADLAPASARALTMVGTEHAWRTLRTSLQSDTQTYQREAAIQAFRLAGRSAVPALVTALSDGDALARARAVTLLADIGSPRAIPPLRRLLDDESVQVRTAATHALGQLGDVSSRPTLEQLADAGNSNRMRDVATQAVAQIDENPRLLPYDVVQYDPLTRSTDMWRTIALILPWLIITVLLLVRHESDDRTMQNEVVDSGEVNEDIP